MDSFARYFDLLDVPRNASLEVVKRAYRDLAQIWHPDRYAHNPRLRSKAEEKLKEINEAYQQLAAYFRRTGDHAAQSRNPSPGFAERTESRAQEPPPKSSPHSSPPPQTPPPTTATTTSSPQVFQRPTERAGCILTLLFFVIVLFATSRSKNKTRYSLIPPTYYPLPALSPPSPSPALPPRPTPQLELPSQPQIQKSAPTTERSELSELKREIEERIARKDVEFDRLQNWYQRGVSAQDEASYRASLEKFQQEEEAVEALILNYNAQKKEHDAQKTSE